MKKTLLLAGVASTLLVMNANAVELQHYVSAKFTNSDMSNDVKYETVKENADDNVLGASIAYGVKIGTIRTEVELNIHEDAEKKYADEYETWKNSVENNSVMLNAYYDIDTGSKFTPYIGGGIGVAKLKGKVSYDEETDSVKNDSFAWQLGAGVSYAMTDNLSLDAGYRYVDYGDVTIKEDWGKVEFDSTSHELHIGARYTF